MLQLAIKKYRLKYGVYTLFLVMCLVCAGQAQATAPECTWTSVQLSPQITTLEVTPIVGNVPYRGELRVDYSCFFYGAGSIAITPNIGGAGGKGMPLYWTTGLWIVATFVPSTTNTLGSSCWSNGGGIAAPDYAVVTLRSDRRQTCTGVLTQPFRIEVRSTPVAGTISKSNANSKYRSWVNIHGSKPPFGDLPADIPVSAAICTLSTPSMVVRLPSTTNTLLSVPGAVAGLTPFTISLRGCNGSGRTYFARASWSFIQGVSDNVIANTATTNPAANVQVQMLDSQNKPIVNGKRTDLAKIVSGQNAYDITYHAQYYAKGAAGAGKVEAVAYYIISYE
ncbi:Fimbrial protein [Solimicrobium silvestre]|uniref:Fimbrial protein n=2 Tax=Solimicrobium silvestre TaxID=2099400 RepID=A0A2S9GUW2_9BURK|nr:Fimbrial protein [Solimicrobium silvestre]